MLEDKRDLSSKIFDLDNVIMRFFSRVFDIVVLNFIFIICCIPVFTIGTSLTALYSVTLKMVKNEESHIIRSFLKAFKENFKQGTIIGILASVITLLVTLDLKILYVIGNEKLKVLQVLCYIVAIWGYIIFLYAFPILAKFENTTKEVLKNSIMVSIVNFKSTILLMILNMPFIIMLFYSGVSMILLFTILIIFGFSSLTLIKSYIFYKVFNKYEK